MIQDSIGLMEKRLALKPASRRNLFADSPSRRKAEDRPYKIEPVLKRS